MKKIGIVVIIACLLMVQLNVKYVGATNYPTATIVVADTKLKIGQTTTVTFTFSEAVSGLTIADVTVPNGTLSNLSTSDNIIWTAKLTPSTNVTYATNVITLNNAGVQDANGNTGVGTTTSNNYAVDTVCPTATIEVKDTTLKAGQTTTVTITFSEAVSGLSLADLTVQNGILSNLSTSDNIVYTATLTPSANITDATNVITLNNAGVQDANGNTGEGTTTSNNYAVGTVRPTATIEVKDTTLKAGQTTTVTFTFSEAVTGFGEEGVTVSNGTISNLSTSDGGITYTATLTPSVNVTAATNVIILDNTGVRNVAENKGEGTTPSNNYAVDTKLPTPQPSNPTPGNSSPVPQQPTAITVATVIENGRQLYEANISLENIQYEIQRLGKEQVLTVNFPTGSWEVRAILAQAAAQLLIDRNIQWQLQQEYATILIPSLSLQNVTAPVTFHLLPVVENNFRQLQKNAEQQLGSTMQVTLLGKPVTIETNLQNRPVTLTLPIPTDATAEQIASLLVYIEHSDGTIEVKRGKIVELGQGAKGYRFETNHFSTFALLYAGERELEPTVLAPYIKGYPDGSFQPNAVVTRGEMATMIARFVTNNNIPKAEASFEDTKTSVHKDAIEFVKQLGLFNGTTKTTFNPNGQITRSQMASVIARWVDAMCKGDASKTYCQQANSTKVFTDVNPTHWAASAIEKVSALGIMTGNSATTFNPNGALTRAQAVKVLNRLFERQAVEGLKESVFSDVPASHWAIGEIEAAATEQIVKK